MTQRPTPRHGWTVAPRIPKGTQGARGGAPRLKSAPSAAESTLSFANLSPEAARAASGIEQTQDLSLSELSPVRSSAHVPGEGDPVDLGAAPRKRRLWPAAALGALLAVSGVGWFASSKARVPDAAPAPQRPAPLTAPARQAAPAAPAVARPAPAAPAVAEGSGAASAAAERAPAEAVDAPAPEPAADVEGPESANAGAAAQPDSLAPAAARETAGARAAELVDRARALHKRKKYAPAKARYRDALKVYPDYPPAIAGLAQLAIRQRDGKQAVQLARQLVSLEPEEASHQVLLGDAYKSASKRKEAREAWKAAARMGSAEARARLRR